MAILVDIRHDELVSDIFHSAMRAAHQADFLDGQPCKPL